MRIVMTGAKGRAPYWLPIPGFDDLAVKVRPLEPETVVLARIKAGKQADKLADMRAELVSYGGDASALPNLDDADEAAAFREVAFIIALGQASILEIKGAEIVDDETGAPVADRDAAVAALLRTHPVGARFRDAYLAEHLARSAEKNASAPSPGGTSESALAGAGAAAPHPAEPETPKRAGESAEGEGEKSGAGAAPTA